MIVEFRKSCVLTLLTFVKSGREKPRYSLGTLLAGMTPDSLHQDLVWIRRDYEVW